MFWFLSVFIVENTELECNVVLRDCWVLWRKHCREWFLFKAKELELHTTGPIKNFLFDTFVVLTEIWLIIKLSFALWLELLIVFCLGPIEYFCC